MSEDLEKRVKKIEDLLSLKNLFFGRCYNTVGESSSDFLIKTKGQVKVLWGNKFIDLIKDGKLNVSTEFIFKGDEVGKKEGIWILPNNEVWVLLKNGDPINLKGIDLFVAFDYEQDLTPEQLIQALFNIGFLYNDVSDINTDFNRIVYVIKELSLYIVSDGKTFPLEINNNKEELDLPYITYDGTTVIINNNLEITEYEINCPTEFISNIIKSIGGSYDIGFLLEYKDGESILCVDKLYVRTGIPVPLTEVYPEMYYNNVNRIDSIIEETDNVYNVNLLFKNTFEVNDTIGIYVQFRATPEDDYVYSLKEGKVLEVSDYRIKIKASDEDLDYTEYKKKVISLIKRKDTSILLLDKDGNLNLTEDTARYGDLKDLELNRSDKGEDVPIENFGLYSKIGAFKESYYTSDYELDEEDDSSRMASTEWVRKILEKLLFPGMIVGFNGDSIPDGWVKCDGTNGTPKVSIKDEESEKEILSFIMKV